MDLLAILEADYSHCFKMMLNWASVVAQPNLPKEMAKDFMKRTVNSLKTFADQFDQLALINEQRVEMQRPREASFNADKEVSESLPRPNPWISRNRLSHFQSC